MEIWCKWYRTPSTIQEVPWTAKDHNNYMLIQGLLCNTLTGSHQVKEICRYATNKLFTHVIILAERGKVCEGFVCLKTELDWVDLNSLLTPCFIHNRFLLIQLTTGPTAFYRVRKLHDLNMCTSQLPALTMTWTHSLASSSLVSRQAHPYRDMAAPPPTSLKSF